MRTPILTSATAGWVGLYVDASGRLLVHRDGSPYAYVVRCEAFAVLARELADGELVRWDGEILVRPYSPHDQWPGTVGRLLAVWDSGHVWERDGPQRTPGGGLAQQAVPVDV